LKLDYVGLKKRAGSKDSDSSAESPAFVELASPVFTGTGECVVEFEDGSGASIRVHLRGCDPPDLVALGRSFWSGR
jgi:hypothetical protein